MLDRTDPWGAIVIPHGSVADFFHQQSPREQKVRELGLPTLPERISQHFLRAGSAPTCALRDRRRETTIVIFYTGIHCRDDGILLLVAGKKGRQFPDPPPQRHLPFGLGSGRLKKTEEVLPQLKQLGSRWKLMSSLPKASSEVSTHFPPQKSQLGDSSRGLRVSK